MPGPRTPVTPALALTVGVSGRTASIIRLTNAASANHAQIADFLGLTAARGPCPYTGPPEHAPDGAIED